MFYRSQFLAASTTHATLELLNNHLQPRINAVSPDFTTCWQWQGTIKKPRVRDRKISRKNITLGEHYEFIRTIEKTQLQLKIKGIGIIDPRKLAYELFNPEAGLSPYQLVKFALCRNDRCINPKHFYHRPLAINEDNHYPTYLKPSTPFYAHAVGSFHPHNAVKPNSVAETPKEENLPSEAKNDQQIDFKDLPLLELQSLKSEIEKRISELVPPEPTAETILAKPEKKIDPKNPWGFRNASVIEAELEEAERNAPPSTSRIKPNATPFGDAMGKSLEKDQWFETQLGIGLIPYSVKDNWQGFTGGFITNSSTPIKNWLEKWGDKIPDGYIINGFGTEELDECFKDLKKLKDAEAYKLSEILALDNFWIHPKIVIDWYRDLDSGTKSKIIINQ